MEKKRGEKSSREMGEKSSREMGGKKEKEKKKAHLVVADKMAREHVAVNREIDLRRGKTWLYNNKQERKKESQNEIINTDNTFLLMVKRPVARPRGQV